MKRAVIKKKDGTLEIISVLDENEILKETIEKIGNIMIEYYKKEEREKTRKENRKENENV